VRVLGLGGTQMFDWSEDPRRARLKGCYEDYVTFSGELPHVLGSISTALQCGSGTDAMQMEYVRYLHASIKCVLLCEVRSVQQLNKMQKRLYQEVNSTYQSYRSYRSY